MKQILERSPGTRIFVTGMPTFELRSESALLGERWVHPYVLARVISSDPFVLGWARTKF